MRHVVSGVVALLLVGACSGGDETADTTTTTRPEATESPGTASSTTATATEPADPFAIPDAITIEYVQRVLEEHERVVREGTQIAIDNGGVTPEVDVRYRAVLGEEFAQADLDDLTQLAAAGFATLRRDQGARGIEVLELYSTTEQCIGALVEFSFDLVLIDPRPPAEQNVELRRPQPGQDPAGYNQTPWITEFSLNPGGEGNPPPCTG